MWIWVRIRIPNTAGWKDLLKSYNLTRANCAGNMQQSAGSAAHCSQAGHQEVVLHSLSRVGTLLNTHPELRSQHRVNVLRIPESSFI
jgi:hypothetical protein